MNSRLSATAGLAGLLVIAALAAADQQVAPATAAAKTDVTSARLLLPLYLVDTTDPDGVTTIFSVRNELDVPADDRDPLLPDRQPPGAPADR